MTTTISSPPGRHKRTHTNTHVPTDRSHARCLGSHHLADATNHTACPLHLPALYALEAAKHRSDR